MAESLKIIIIVLIMIMVLIYARKFRARQMQKAARFIVDDLKSKGALDAASAVELPYAKRVFLRIGFRDERPKVIRQMVQMGVIGVTENGRFYLNESALSNDSTVAPNDQA